jgi:hypothetical protein
MLDCVSVSDAAEDMSLADSPSEAVESLLVPPPQAANAAADRTANAKERERE